MIVRGEARQTRLLASGLLLLSVVVGILNLTVLHDPEVTLAPVVGATVAIAALVAVRPRKDHT